MNQQFLFFITFILLLGLGTSTMAQCTRDDIEVPEMLEPDNEKEEAQTLMLSTKGIKDAKILIFDKWGKQVFESSISMLGAVMGKEKMSDTGWDGKKSGEELKAGLYVYTVDATCVDQSHVRRGGTIILTRK